MTRDELYDLICDIVNKHTTTIWITPYTPKRYIPSEEIYNLKEDLFHLMNALKGREK